MKRPAQRGVAVARHTQAGPTKNKVGWGGRVGLGARFSRDRRHRPCRPGCFPPQSAGPGYAWWRGLPWLACLDRGREAQALPSRPFPSPIRRAWACLVEGPALVGLPRWRKGGTGPAVPAVSLPNPQGLGMPGRSSRLTWHSKPNDQSGQPASQPASQPANNQSVNKLLSLVGGGPRPDVPSPHLQHLPLPSPATPAPPLTCNTCPDVPSPHLQQRVRVERRTARHVERRQLLAAVEQRLQGAHVGVAEVQPPQLG
eukprot:354554-Chlamydomonas_euryale.AAC.1